MRTRILAVVLALGGLLAVAQPAGAATSYTGRFNWGADVKHEIDSRFWVQKVSGTVEIQSACKATNGEKYTITLLGYTGSSPTKTYTCTDDLQPHTWTGVPKGTYKFRLHRAKEHSTAVHFSGNVFYP